MGEKLISNVTVIIPAVRHESAIRAMAAAEIACPDETMDAI